MLTVGLGGQLFQSVTLELWIFLPHLESRVLVLTDWRRVRCLLKGAWTSLFFKPYPWWPGQWLHHFWSSQSRFSNRQKPKNPTPIEFQSAASPTQSNSMKAHHLALRVALAYYCDSPYKYKVCMSPPTPPPPPPLSPCISTELLLLLRAVAAAVAEGKLVWWKERKKGPSGGQEESLLWISTLLLLSSTPSAGLAVPFLGLATVQ
mgnify:CR=1 FL=1